MRLFDYFVKAILGLVLLASFIFFILGGAMVLNLPATLYEETGQAGYLLLYLLPLLVLSYFIGALAVLWYKEEVKGEYHGEEDSAEEW